jgi:hypothetical protein
MTLETDPPVMTLNTDDPPDKSGNKPPDAPKDPPKPDTGGTDVVPVVGDLGGGGTTDAPAPKPDTSDAPIGVRITGTDSGQTFAFLGPEHALPGSGPAKLDGGFSANFAGCTTGIDKTCGFTVAHNQLGAYGLGRLGLAGSHPILNLVLSGNLATSPSSDDACRSKQQSGGRETVAMARAFAIRTPTELPVTSIRVRGIR